MVICGVTSDKEVYIGSDSIIDTDIPSLVSPSLNIYRKNGYVIGVETTPRMMYHLRTSFTPPKRSDRLTLEIHLATLFYREFIRCLEPYHDQVKALIGSMGKLFYLDSLYGVVECIDGYMAIGNGADIALGSLYSTMNMAGYKRIAIALTAATKHGFVRPPYTILSSGLYAVSRYSPDFHTNMTEVDIAALGGSNGAK